MLAELWLVYYYDVRHDSIKYSLLEAYINFEKQFWTYQSRVVHVRVFNLDSTWPGDHVYFVTQLVGCRLLNFEAALRARRAIAKLDSG